MNLVPVIILLQQSLFTGYNSLSRPQKDAPMSISILVEPAANGYRAEAGSPLDLSAEAGTAAEAVAALRAKIADR